MPISLEFIDFGIDLGGATVEVFIQSSSFVPLLTLVQRVDIPAGTHGNAIVTINPVTAVPHFVRLEVGVVRFRSGPIEIAQADLNNADPRRVTFALFPPDPPTVTVARADVLAMAPATPFVSGAITVTTLTMLIGANVLRATGAATHRATTVVRDPFGLGISMTFTKATPVTYTVDFELKPRHAMPPGPSVIRVNVTASVVRGASGGPLGTVQNAVVGVITALVADRIRDSVEDELQDQIDDGVAARLNGQGLPDGSTVTVETITIDGLGIHMTPVVGVPGAALAQSLDCAGVLASGSVRFRKAAEQSHMRAVRDLLLARTPQGVEYLTMLEAHMPEIVAILLANPALLKNFDDSVRAILKEFPAKSPEKGRLSKATAAKLTKFLSGLGKSGSSGLAAACTGLVADIPQLVGEDLAKMLTAGWVVEKNSEKKPAKKGSR